jgi:hypothetical protein
LDPVRRRRAVQTRRAELLCPAGVEHHEGQWRVGHRDARGARKRSGGQRRRKFSAGVCHGCLKILLMWANALCCAVMYAHDAQPQGRPNIRIQRSARVLPWAGLWAAAHASTIECPQDPHFNCIGYRYCRVHVHMHAATELAAGPAAWSSWRLIMQLCATARRVRTLPRALHNPRVYCTLQRVASAAAAHPARLAKRLRKSLHATAPSRHQRASEGAKYNVRLVVDHTGSGHRQRPRSPLGVKLGTGQEVIQR